jgi:hypothetical protein
MTVGERLSPARQSLEGTNCALTSIRTRAELEKMPVAVDALTINQLILVLLLFLTYWRTDERMDENEFKSREGWNLCGPICLVMIASHTASAMIAVRQEWQIMTA